MKRILVFCLLLLPFFAEAQREPQVVREVDHDVRNYARDSFRMPGIRFFLYHRWRFYEGDSAAMALPEYDDSNWDTVHADLRSNGKERAFNSVGWFRYHFTTDSTINDFPLAIAMSHYGASEVYLDGEKLRSYGVINGKDSSEYFDPQSVPLLLNLRKAGPHVIAIRYANYDADKNLKIYHSNFRGFRVYLGEAKYMIISDRGQSKTFGVIYMFLFGMFISLAMSHFFLYLYYRSSKSNLYFSIFCLSLAAAFLTTYINRMSYSPTIQLVNSYVAIIIISLACFSMSGFTNELFSVKKLRFRIVKIVCLLCPVIWIINFQAGIICYFLLVGSVLVQTIILIIRAMYQRVKGARILGSGILFFAAFLFITLMIALVAPFEEASPTGQIVVVVAALAILSIPVSLSLYLAWSFAGINKHLQRQLEQVELLSAQTREQEQEKQRILEGQKENLEREVVLRTTEVVSQKEKIEKQHRELKIEKKKSDDLLLNILPEEIAEELKEKGFSEARSFNDVTVLFTDFVSFTKAGETMNAQELVNELHVCFKTFDEIIAKYNIEKIKTIGDAYLAVCGLPVSQPDHASNTANAALEIAEFMKKRKRELGQKTFDIRIGIHSGGVVAGIVGVKKFAYDIWGDTVNTAARMEQNSEAGRINISQTTFDLIKNKFECTYRGEIDAKNKGAMAMYFIEKVK